MYKKILVPTDGSALSEKAIAHGTDIAAETHAKLVILTVTAPYHVFALDPAMVSDTPAGYTVRMGAHVASVLGKAAAAAKAKGVDCETIHVEQDHPYEAIIQVAGAKGCDAILMASHGRRGPAAMILGSETVKVLTHSQLPVIVYR